MKRPIIIMLGVMLLCGCAAVNEGDNVTNGQVVSDYADNGQEIGESNDINNNQLITDDNMDNAPIDTDRIRKVEVLYENTFIITGSGEFWAWGSNQFEQLCKDKMPDTRIPQKLLDDVASANMGVYSWAIKENGELWTWGVNRNGELGDGTTVNRSTPQKIMDGVKSVGGSDHYGVALKNNGEVWTWGSNYSGQLGDGTFVSKSTPQKVMDHVTSIETYAYTIYAVKEDGGLWFWGYHTAGGFLDDFPGDVSEPLKIMDDVNKVIPYGLLSIFFIKNNDELWGWGENNAGELGTDQSVSGPIKIMDGVKDMVDTAYGCVALKENGECWLWGKTMQEEQKIEKPQKVLDDVAQICQDDNHPLLIRNNGELWQCAIIYPEDGTGNNEIMVDKLMDDICLAAGDSNIIIAVTKDNRILSWPIWDSSNWDWNTWKVLLYSDEINPKEIVLDGETEVPYYASTPDQQGL